MKPAARRQALRAARLHHRGNNTAAIAQKLRLRDSNVAGEIAHVGLLIQQCEAHRLTGPEQLVMETIARLEARRVALGGAAPAIGQVDHAAGKRSGWTGKTIAKRLRSPRPSDAGVRDITNRLAFIAYPNDAGRIWLTPAGWAFVWATGLIDNNWRAP
jgi:hypothetical protein